MPFEDYIQRLVDRRILPGLSLLVGRGEDVIFKGHWGCASLKPERESLNENTLYDTASLTKPLITAFASVYLCERREIDLEGSIQKYLPELPFDIKVSQLLTHTSGLPAWFPFYLYADDYLGRFKSLRLQSKPGKSVEYSCVGYILLYYLIQQVTGTPFAEFVHDLLIKPLALKNTFLKVPQEKRKLAAPTEEGNRFERAMAQKKFGRLSRGFQWREYMIRGEAHDVNSHWLGGTAGNAGLFSCTSDLFKLSLEFFPSTCTILTPESVRLFWKNFTPGKTSHRSIGFKLNSSFVTSGGRALSKDAIGHNGFTGTSLWFEPQSEYKFILLSNRIHPVVKTINFDKIRRKLHRLLKRDLVLP